MLPNNLVKAFEYKEQIIRPKKEICVFWLHLKKIRVGRSLLIFFFFLKFYLLFSLILTRNRTDALFA